MSLRELRTARHRTQASVASAVGIGQDGVSRLEKRGDLLLSTLRGYVEAVGGRLSLVATFPDRDAVIISTRLTGAIDPRPTPPAARAHVIRLTRRDGTSGPAKRR